MPSSNVYRSSVAQSTTRRTITLSSIDEMRRYSVWYRQRSLLGTTSYGILFAQGCARAAAVVGVLWRVFFRNRSEKHCLTLAGTSKYVFFLRSDTPTHLLYWNLQAPLGLAPTRSAVVPGVKALLRHN